MDEIKSKSQKKREADALQKIGVALVAMSVDKLTSLPLNESLMRAIIEAKSLKSHGAIRRQAQLIGKLMRLAESDGVLEAYERLIAEDSAQTATFHEVERWRERLIRDGNDALTDFVQAYRPDDLQQLRQLIKKATDEKVKEQNLGASKALFRYLRTYVQ